MESLSPQLLETIVQRLVECLKPEQIILFGSYAYGKPNKDSDVDLLVIVSESVEPRYRRAREAYRALRDIGIAKDVIVMTRQEVNGKVGVPSSFVYEAMHEGIILYG